MYKRSIFFIALAIFTVVVFQQISFTGPENNVNIEQKYTKCVLLIPLDSRPPCSKFVIDAGKLVNIRVIVPPQEIMDYYTEAGDTGKLRDWLMNNATKADGIIVSTDQLLYGGLLASRQSFGRHTDENAVWSALKQIRETNKSLPIYVFNILPRITPPANIDAAKDIKNLMEYSRLVDRFSQFYDEKDLKKLAELRGKISQKHLEQYELLYEKNLQLNKELIDLCAAGVINKIVIGQDDGEEYGMPNIERRFLQRYIVQKNLNAGQAVVTHGADEVAMSLLFNMAQQFNATVYQPKIYAAYTDDAAADKIFPYMAAPVKQIVEEKIEMTGGRPVKSPDEADFILYMHIGDVESLSVRRLAAQQLKNWLDEGKKVALVDLSRHFTADETLFPVLLADDIPVNQLTAYSGWNTVSNSIGTAVAQASIYCLAQHNEANEADALRLSYNNLTILYDHFTEDYFYLKGTIDAVNTALRKAGIDNVSDLNMDNNYLWANQMLSISLQRQLDKFAYSKASRAPIRIDTPDGKKKIYIRNLRAAVFFPWPRTFEIYTDVKFNLLTESQ